jgi:hypothetical protein
MKPATTSEISFDATASEVQETLRAISLLHQVDVRRSDCINPEKECSWDITFVGLRGKVSLLLEPYWDGLLNGSNVAVTRVLKGQKNTFIDGFPTTVEVAPGEMDSGFTIAHRSGLLP